MFLKLAALPFDVRSTAVLIDVIAPTDDTGSAGVVGLN